MTAGSFSLDRSLRRPILLAAVAILLALLAYLPSLGGPFFSDDFAYIVDNPVLQSTSPATPWRFFTTRTNPFEYLPVRDFSYRLDLALFGLNPLGFRLHNLLLYGLSGAACWLCVFATTRLLRKEAMAAWVATAATALFMAHPAHVESVAWISGRKDLLSGLFTFLALWLFARSLATCRRPVLLRLGAAALFILALLSKAAAIPLALVALLLVAMVSAQRAKQHLPRTRDLMAALPLLLVAAAGAALHMGVATQTEILASGNSEPQRLSGGGLLDSLLIAGHLFRLALLPVRLRLIYDLHQTGWEQVLAMIMAGILLAALPLCLWLACRGRNLWAFGMGAFILFCLPYTQLVPFHTWSLVSERFLFIPLLGLSLTAAVLIFRAGRPVARVAVPVAVALLLAATAGRAADWRSPAGLWAENAAYAPGEYRVVEPYIDSLLDEGRYGDAGMAVGRIRSPEHRRTLTLYVQARDLAAHGNKEGAAALVRQVVASLSWDRSVFYLKLANLAQEVGVPAEAVTLYQSVLAKNPRDINARYNLGLALKKTGRHEEAAAQIQRAVEGGLHLGDGWNNLGLLRRELGDPAAAEAAFLAALSDDESHWHAAYNLARLYLAQGRPGEARKLLLTARERAIRAGDSTQPVDQLLAGLSAPD